MACSECDDVSMEWSACDDVSMECSVCDDVSMGEKLTMLRLGSVCPSDELSSDRHRSWSYKSGFGGSSWKTTDLIFTNNSHIR